MTCSSDRVSRWFGFITSTPSPCALAHSACAQRSARGALTAPCVCVRTDVRHDGAGGQRLIDAQPACPLSCRDGAGAAEENLRGRAPKGIKRLAAERASATEQPCGEDTAWRNRGGAHQQTGRGVDVWRRIDVDAANEAPLQAAPRQQQRLHVRRDAKRQTLVVCLAGARASEFRARGGAARTTEL